MPGEYPSADGLSPNVAELVGKVTRKMASAATPDEIRLLAAKAIRDTRDNKLTIGEIRELADAAISRANKIDDLVTRLAELLEEARSG